MTRIVLVDEVGVSYLDSQIFTRAVEYFIPLVASAWSKDKFTVQWASAPVGKTYEGDGTDWVIYLSERNRHAGALGYHNKTSAGTPFAFCSLKLNGNNLFGRYHRAKIVKGKTFGVSKFIGTGLITTVCHEIAEMIADPKVETMSALDKLGRSWLVEIADPIDGNYLLFTDPVSSTDCVLPDIALPSFYSLKGSQPYSLAHSVSAPFTLAKPKGYAYYKNALGSYIRV
jgi:hypothetical protein